MRSKIQAQLSRIPHKNFVSFEKYPYFCRFTSQDYDSYKCLLTDLRKLKDVKIDRSYFTLVVDVYDIEDYRHLQEFYRRKK